MTPKAKAESVVSECQHARNVGGTVVYGREGEAGACAACIALALTEQAREIERLHLLLKMEDRAVNAGATREAPDADK